MEHYGFSAMVCLWFVGYCSFAYAVLGYVFPVTIPKGVIPVEELKVLIFILINFHLHILFRNSKCTPKISNICLKAMKLDLISS